MCSSLNISCTYYVLLRSTSNPIVKSDTSRLFGYMCAYSSVQHDKSRVERVTLSFVKSSSVNIETCDRHESVTHGSDFTKLPDCFHGRSRDIAHGFLYLHPVDCRRSAAIMVLEGDSVFRLSVHSPVIIPKVF